MRYPCLSYLLTMEAFSTEDFDEAQEKIEKVLDKTGVTKLESQIQESRALLDRIDHLHFTATSEYSYTDWHEEMEKWKKDYEKIKARGE